MSRFDSQWYRRITIDAYPLVLPTDSAGHVAPNNWAFLPGFAWLVRLLQTSLAAEWWAIAPALATIFGGLFIYASFKLFRLRLDEPASLWAIALLSFSTASGAFSIGYADSLGLALTAWALYHVVKRRYLLAQVPIWVLAFVRPGAIIFAGLFVVLLIFNKANRVSAAVAMVSSALAGLAWPIVAALATSNPTAYFETENAWRRASTQSDSVDLFQGWFSAFSAYSGPIVGAIVVLALVATTTIFLASKSVRALGLELHAYLVAVAFYVFAVFYPQSSTMRVLLIGFPAFAALAVATSKRSTRFKAWVLIASIASQAPGFGWSMGRIRLD